LVGILNADNMLNFPDFRAHERSFQLMVQVSGRAGRVKKQGKVAIQTYNPYHQILQQVSTNNYAAMYKEQLEERYQYKYPPYLRIVKVTLKHKDFNKLNRASEWLGTSFRNQFNEYVLGPTAPAVARVRNQYIKHILIKLPTLTYRQCEYATEKVAYIFPAQSFGKDNSILQSLCFLDKNRNTESIAVEKELVWDEQTDIEYTFND